MGKLLTASKSNSVTAHGISNTINTEGNAMLVYKYAEEFLSDEEKQRKYDLYEKHLVFDCDAPANIQEVIDLMKNSW